MIRGPFSLGCLNLFSPRYTRSFLALVVVVVVVVARARTVRALDPEICLGTIMLIERFMSSHCFRWPIAIQPRFHKFKSLLHLRENLF